MLAQRDMPSLQLQFSAERDAEHLVLSLVITVVHKKQESKAEEAS